MTDSSPNPFTGAIYMPPSQGLPILVALFKNGHFVGSRAVNTVAEAEAHIEQALIELLKLSDDEED